MVNILFEFCDDSITVIKSPLSRGVEHVQYDSVNEGDIVGIEMYLRSREGKYSKWEFTMEDLAKAEIEEVGFGVNMGEYKGRWTISPLDKKSEK